MVESRPLAARLEEQRALLLRAAYRLLGSLREADDVVEHAWRLLLDREAGDVDDAHAWLLTTVARACLDRLRAQKARRDRSLGARLPDPLITPPDHPHPARDLPDGGDVSLALLVVLETLTPRERVVYVLHDLLAVPLAQIATIVERSDTAARQLERRARSRVSGATRMLGATDRNERTQHRVVAAFLTAARMGDFDALLAVLDPDVVLRADRGVVLLGGTLELRGAGLVAKQALTLSKLTERAEHVVVNGGPGVISWLPGGQPFAVLAFTVLHDKLVELYVFADPTRLARLDLTFSTRT